MKRVNNTDSFIAESRAIYGDKYSYDNSIYTDNKTKLMIEYDGEQHFREIKFFNGCYEKVKKNDNIKNDYAKTKGMKLLRIPYFDFHKIDEILCFHFDYNQSAKAEDK